MNIALMNELSIIFNKMGINTYDVPRRRDQVEFHPHATQLVGGHCIGVDPYYLTYKGRNS